MTGIDEKYIIINGMSGLVVKLNLAIAALIQWGSPRALVPYSAGSGVGLLVASSATMTNSALVTLSICGDK